MVRITGMKELPANLLRLILHIKGGGKIYLRGWFDEAEIAWVISSEAPKVIWDYCTFSTAKEAIEFLISQDANLIQIVAARSEETLVSSGSLRLNNSGYY